MALSVVDSRSGVSVATVTEAPAAPSAPLEAVMPLITLALVAALLPAVTGLLRRR